MAQVHRAEGFFFDLPTPGHQVRAFGQGLLANHGISGVELFPKQDQLGKGPGSLTRMPFGLHRLAGRRCGFITPDGEHLAPTIREQIRLFSAPQTVPEAAFEAYESHVPAEPPPAVSAPVEEPTGPLSERIKTSVTVLEFVGRLLVLVAIVMIFGRHSFALTPDNKKSRT